MFDGKMVAVKIINPGYINNFGVFKRVRLFPSPKYLLPTSFSVWILPEAVHQRGHVETATTSECSQFPWVRLPLPSILPCIPLDSQREFV